MPDYHFEHLGTKNFEHLVVALGIDTISKGLKVYGAGPDGGREATYDGKMDYPTSAEPWDGYLVIQCKLKEERGASPKEEADWAINQLNLEMSKFIDAKVERIIPEYYIFATNANLSAMPKTGGKDRFDKELERWRSIIGIKSAEVWDREKLSRLVDGNQKVAERFGLLHSGDLINYAAQSALSHRTGVKITLKLFLQEELRLDQYVRLAQAGHTSDEQTPLARVFVDLKGQIQDTNRNLYVVKAIQESSDRPIYPTLISKEIGSTVPEGFGFNKNGQSGNYWSDPSRFVLVGGPGQGKSTLTQHLAQRHRAALLERHEPSTLEFETQNILTSIKLGAQHSETHLPEHPRFPFRIVLEQFADSLAKGEVNTVLDYIAQQVRRRSGREFTRTDAEELIKNTPCFVAFDGLDEVPAVSNRGEVLETLRKFLSEAKALDSDLLIVATTRPQGYENEFNPSYYNHLILKALSIDEALNYAQKFVEAKYSSDYDRQERIMERLRNASKEEATARLMISPLQVTIMAALVDFVGNPPRERYPLFNRYYEVVYQREQERGLVSSAVLAEHKEDIDSLHDKVGLLLQIETETVGQAQGRISSERLTSLVEERLLAEGYEGEQLRVKSENLLSVVLQRLVFIAPLEENRFGFEVRSLQEFAAARALMDGSYDEIKARLVTVAPVPYWRNTVLFAIGKAFTAREDLRDIVCQLCRELNNNTKDIILSKGRVGSRLAVDILNDGVVDRKPKYNRLLLDTALEILDLPDVDLALKLVDLYSEEYSEKFESTIRKFLGSNLQSKQASSLILICKLASDYNFDWAIKILKEFWPEDILFSRYLVKAISKNVSWDPHFIDYIETTAKRSSPQWVSEHLADHSPIDWIKNSRSAVFSSHSQSLDIRINDISNRIFSYRIPKRILDEEVLKQIENANPTHIGWRLIILSKDFIIKPSIESFASTLIKIKEFFPTEDYHSLNLFWPLHIVINILSASDEFSDLAQKALHGQLGSVDDWSTALDRWAEKGFSPKDLNLLNNETWPFDKSIVENGVPPIQFYSLSHSTDTDIATECVISFLEAFDSCQFPKAKRELADAFWFSVSGPSLDREVLKSKLSIQLLDELTIGPPWWIDPLVILSIFDSEPMIIANADFLDRIGKRLRIASFSERGMVDDSSFENFANILAILTKSNPASEGILRFLSYFSFRRSFIADLKTDLKKLTIHGMASVVLIQIFNEHLNLLSPEVISEYIINNWNVQTPGLRAYELQFIVNYLLENNELSQKQIAILSILSNSEVLGLGTLEQIFNSITSQTNYRTSGLDTAQLLRELGI